MSNYYIFECLLPFAISIPQKSELKFSYQGLSLLFIHSERHTSKDLNFEISATTKIPSDRFGLYIRSRIAIVFDEEALRRTMTPKDADIFDLDGFFSHRFFNPSNDTTRLVIGAINRVLKLIRVVCADWHATSLTPKDLTNLKFLKQSLGATQVLTSSYFTHQIASASFNSEEDEHRLKVLRSGLAVDADLDPLAVMESEIHDHVARGDLYLSTILMGTLVELAIKKHLIRYLIFDQNLSMEDAEFLVKDDRGHFRNISRFLDNRTNSLCLMEKYVGWQPYNTDEYEAWKTLVRYRRNAALHSGPINLTRTDVEAAWIACCDFIQLSFRSCIGALLAKGINITEQDSDCWFSPISRQLYPEGLIGNHSDVC